MIQERRKEDVGKKGRKKECRESERLRGLWESADGGYGWVVRVVGQAGGRRMRGGGFRWMADRP